MRFEWDENKAAQNLVKHGVSFAEAVQVFDDPDAIVEFDEAHSFSEERFIIIGFSSRQLLLVIYAEKAEDTIRLISARKPSKEQQKEYEPEGKLGKHRKIKFF